MPDIYDLIKTKRIHLTHSQYPEYDAATHLIKVMQYAVEHDCVESLVNAIGRLAPDADSDNTIIMSAEDPYNFFWYRVPREELERELKAGSIPTARGRYHGGLIGHAVHQNGEPTMKREWSIHT